MVHRMRGSVPNPVSVAALVAACAVSLACSGGTAGGARSATARFAKHDRARLAELISQGRLMATILIAYPPGHGDELLERLATLGAQVRYRVDTIGYLRADLPTERVLEAAALPGIDAINLSGTQVYGASSPPASVNARAVDSVRWRVAPPNSSTPRENPYLPMRDVGAPQFVTAHPTFDGRGVTIGSIECCPDFRHPVFQEPALTLDGQPARKLAALYTVVAADSEAVNRVPARDWVEAVDRRFTYEGVSYRTRRDGRFRIGRYTGPAGFKRFEQWQADTLDRSAEGRAVLLDPHSGEVWVDVLDDRDFAQAPPLRDYNATGDVGAFGRDDPATPWDDRLSFAVGVDTSQAVVDLYPGDGGHITGVAGIVVGTRFYGGLATGAAPRARMVFVSQGGGWKSLESHQSNGIEGMILLAQRPDVDIITTQVWYGLRLKDGGSVWSIISDRLVTTYHKVLVQSAGNAPPGLGTVGEAVNGTRVLKVGGSVHPDTWYTTFALLANRRDYLFRAARGPHADGGTSPDFLAPMVHLIAWPMGASRDPLIRDNPRLFSSRAIYRNPPGYTLNFGTSWAAPTAAGVAALLVSAARQIGTPVDAARLRWALSGGARYFNRYQAYEQGAGILDVTAAWERMQRAPAPLEIAVDAPVRTVMSPYLRVPQQAAGCTSGRGGRPATVLPAW